MSVDNLEFAKSIYLDYILADYTKTGSNLDGTTFVLDKPGQKYQRVIHKSPNQRASHSFIALQDHVTSKGLQIKQGDILKCASWKAPALNFVRGNITNLNYADRVRWTGVS
jgi:hypothetical protein